MSLFSGKAALLTLPLTGYKTVIRDEEGKPIKLDSTDSVGSGTIQIMIQLISSFSAHMGPIMKQAQSVMGFMKRAGDGGYKRRLLMVTDQILMYFDNEFNLDAPRNSLLPHEVESISETADKAGHRVINVVAHNAKDSWQLAWVDQETEESKQIWMKKLLRFVESAHASTPASRTASTPKKGRRTSVFGF